jgi:hypothetical protein
MAKYGFLNNFFTLNRMMWSVVRYLQCLQTYLSNNSGGSDFSAIYGTTCLGIE